MNNDIFLKRIKNSFDEARVSFEVIANKKLKFVHHHRDYIVLMEKQGEKNGQEGINLFQDLLMINNNLIDLQKENSKLRLSLKYNTFLILTCILCLLYLFKNISLVELLASGFDAMFLTTSLVGCSFGALVLSSFEKIFKIYKSPYYKNYLQKKNNYQREFKKTYHDLDEKIAWYQFHASYLNRNFLEDEKENKDDDIVKKQTPVVIDSLKDNLYFSKKEGSKLEDFQDNCQQQDEKVKVYVKKDIKCHK